MASPTSRIAEMRKSVLGSVTENNVPLRVIASVSYFAATIPGRRGRRPLQWLPLFLNGTSRTPSPTRRINSQERAGRPRPYNGYHFFERDVEDAVPYNDYNFFERDVEDAVPYTKNQPSGTGGETPPLQCKVFFGTCGGHFNRAKRKSRQASETFAKQKYNSPKVNITARKGNITHSARNEYNIIISTGNYDMRGAVIMGYKSDRTAEDIKREITALVRELKDPRVADAMLTVVRVEVAHDLSFAKVYISALGGIAEAETACKALNSSAKGFIKKELGVRLTIRKTPDIRFIADDSIEKSMELFKKLNSVKGKSEE